MSSPKSFKTPKGSFTIINRTRAVNTRRADFERNLEASLKRSAPKTAQLFETLPRPLKEAALSGTAPRAPLTWVKSPRKAIPEQSELVGQFAAAVKLAGQHAQATTVGILDLGARISGMPRLLERLNKAQDRLVFLEVLTPVPAGMVKTGEALVKQFKLDIGRKLTASEIGDIGRNMLVDEFVTLARSVRESNGLDALFGVTPAMLAFREDGQCHWNYFSYGDGALSVISTFDLRRYAKSAGRPFEAAVGMLLVGQLVATRNDIGFHEENRGCALDFNEERDGLVESIRAMRFDEDCLGKITDPAEAQLAKALISTLRRM